MRTKSLVFHFIILGTIIGVFSLGVWQLQRREWKHELIAVMNKNLALPALELPQDAGTEWYWRQVEIAPQINWQKTIYVPRFYNGAWGYEIYAPTFLGHQVIVLRLGWSAQKLDTAHPPRISGNLRAIVRPFGNSMNFMGKNISGNEKPHADASLYDDFGVPKLNFFLDSLDELSGGAVSLWQKPELNDNHLQYAITWFVLAGVLSALYLYKVRHDK